MGGSMFSDVSSTEPEEKQKSKLSLKSKSPKPEKKVKSKSKDKKKKTEKVFVKPAKKSTRKSGKNSSNSKSDVVRVYSYFRNEMFNPDAIETKVSKYLKSLIRLVNKKNSRASVVLHRTDDLMSEINDMILDLEFEISDELIMDSETYVNTNNEGTINVI